MEAKKRLSRALKLAHSISDHQFICQVANLMSTLQAEGGDVPGARQMLSSSITLAKNAHDLPSQIEALNAMEKIYAMQHLEEKVAAMRDRREKKEPKLLQAVHQATSNTKQHTFIAAWDLNANS